MAPLAEAPIRLPPLPAPPPLEHVSQDQKRRIKDIEKRLRLHKKEATLGEDEFAQLSSELEDLRRSVAEVPTGELVPAGDDQGDGEGDAARGVGGSRLAIKREIRDVEKVIKAQKKKPTLSSRELGDLAKRLEKLKAELTSSQDRKRVVLGVHLVGEPHDGQAATALSGATLAVDDRISLAGLSPTQASTLFADLQTQGGGIDACGNSACPGDGWAVWRHPGLRVAALRGIEPAHLAAELEDMAAEPPHVVVVGAESLRARGGICAVLRDFKGALVFVEEEGEEPEAAACLLQALRVKARWRLGAEDGVVALRPEEVPAPLETEVIGDLKWRDVRESSDLSPLLDAAEEECRQEFDENLEEVLASDGIRMGLLVSVLPAGEKVKGRHRAFLGFITYKFWPAPLKTMSISRVAVPKRYQMQGFGKQLVRWAIEKAKLKSRFDCDRVSLSAIPKAINFYERLNFTTVVDEDLPDDEGPGAATDAVKMEFRLGRR